LNCNAGAGAATEPTPTAADSTAADSTAATEPTPTAADSTAADSTAADSTAATEPTVIALTFAWLSAVLLLLAGAGYWCLHMLGRVEPRELLAAACLFR
jgi:hypothetical protein